MTSTVPVNPDAKSNRSGDSDKRTGRLRSSRFVLTRMFTTVAVLAVLCIGVIGVIGARNIFGGTIESQLASLGSDRAETVRDELERAKSDVAVIARDTSIAAATRDFAAAFGELDGDSGALDPEQQQELEAFYLSSSEITGALEESGESAANVAAPERQAARYVQYHYIVDNPFPADQRSDLVDTEDGSDYSAVHSDYHPMLRERATIVDAGDLLLIADDAASTVVYSVNKRIDLGTSLRSGPYSGSALGTAIARELASVPAGEAVLVDFEPYLPAGAQATMFAVAAIRDGTEIVGSVALALPNGLLDGITTFDGDWDSMEIGDAGEVYLVGSDRMMRSESRFWLEDPQGYGDSLASAGYPAEVARRINLFDTTVLAQPADTAAVSAGIAGRTFHDEDENYLGDKTYTFAMPLGMDGLDWVIVSGISVDEARGPLLSYLWAVVILALLTIPVVAAIAYFFARGLTSPVAPLVAAADEIAAGGLDTVVPPLGRNEYGDLGNRVNSLTTALRARDEERDSEEQAISKVLLAALPPRLVDTAREAIKGGSTADGVEAGGLMDTCTVIAVSVSGYFDLRSSDMEEIVEVSSVFAKEVEQLAAGLNIERVRSTPDEYVFTAGLRTPDLAREDAATFVLGLKKLLSQLQSETSRTGEYRIALSAGSVATGLLQGSEMSFGVWGPPVRTALSLGRVADPYQVVVDGLVADGLGDRWNLEPIELVDLEGDRLDAFALLGPGPETDSASDSE